MNLKNIIEYDGQWHKKDKDGNCEDFTMADLEELLAEEYHKGVQDGESAGAYPHSE